MKFGKIKWQFSSFTRFNFSLSILCSVWHFVISCSSYMWKWVQSGFFGYPYILYFVLHGLNSMRPSNMYMHLWNDVIAGLDSGLLTIGASADILFIYTHQIPDMLTNTNSFEIVTFRITFLCYWQTRILTTFAYAQTNRGVSHVALLFFFLIQLPAIGHMCAPCCHHELCYLGLHRVLAYDAVCR